LLAAPRQGGVRGSSIFEADSFPAPAASMSPADIAVHRLFLTHGTAWCRIEAASSRLTMTFGQAEPEGGWAPPPWKRKVTNPLSSLAPGNSPRHAYHHHTRPILRPTVRRRSRIHLCRAVLRRHAGGRAGAQRGGLWGVHRHRRGARRLCTRQGHVDRVRLPRQRHAAPWPASARVGQVRGRGPVQARARPGPSPVRACPPSIPRRPRCPGTAASAALQRAAV